MRSQDSSADALDQLSVDNEREREELLSKIEVEMKEAEQEVVHQYMSHYLLGLKVNVMYLHAQLVHLGTAFAAF